jgi:hypothetical protein
MASELFKQELAKLSSQGGVQARYKSIIEQRGYGILDAKYSVYTDNGASLSDKDIQDIEYAALREVEELIDNAVMSVSKKSVKSSGIVNVSGSTFGWRDKRGKLLGPRSLAQMLNLVLHDYVQKQMGDSDAPSSPDYLRYQTGRFAKSARVVTIRGSKTLQEQLTDGTSIMFTYMLSPYIVFEETSPWASPGRDPRRIISNAIRDALRDIVRTQIGVVDIKRSE